MDQDTKINLLSTIRECLDSESEPELIADSIEAKKKLWISISYDLARERLITIIKNEIARTEVPKDGQLSLPGFENIGPVLRTRVGHASTTKRIITGKANLDQLRNYRNWFLNNLENHNERDQVRLKELNKLVKLMAKHAKANPDITVEEALALEQVKV